MAKLIASVYAKSLFDVAVEIKKEKLICEELEFISDMFTSDSDFYEFFLTPKVSKQKRKAVIENVYGEKVSVEVLNFLKLLLDKQRANEIKSISLYYNKLFDKQQNLKRVTVETVIEMTDKQKNKLISKLEETTKSKIVLENIIKPELLGGIIMRIDNSVVDNSIFSKLRAIEDSVSKIII